MRLLQHALSPRGTAWPCCAWEHYTALGTRLGALLNGETDKKHKNRKDAALDSWRKGQLHSPRAEAEAGSARADRPRLRSGRDPEGLAAAVRVCKRPQSTARIDSGPTSFTEWANV